MIPGGCTDFVGGMDGELDDCKTLWGGIFSIELAILAFTSFSGLVNELY